MIDSRWILLYASAVLLFISACGSGSGEELARLKINKVSKEDHIRQEDVTLDLKKGDELEFWTEMDMSYEGDVVLLFRILIFKDGVDHGSLDLDPRNKSTTLNETKTVENGVTHWKFTAKNHTTPIYQDNNYTYQVLLASGGNDSTLVIRKADLVLKR